MDAFPGQLVSPTRSLLEAMGLGVYGDLGQLTLYTNKNGKLVFYPRNIPEKPPSDRQIRQRQRFAAAMANYRQLSAADMAQWNTLAAALQLVASGINLFLSLSMQPATDTFNDWVSRLGLTISEPEYIPP